MSVPTASGTDAVSQLCPACGLCCNGVLFGDVELQRADDAKRLAGLGLSLFPKGRKQCFNQPCACFDGKLCRIYNDRPSQCRAFECRLVQRVDAGRITVAEAHQSIKAARRQIETVRGLVRELGEIDEQVPLNRRYAAALAKPMDMAGDPSTIKRHGRLMKSVGELAALLERDFLT